MQDQLTPTQTTIQQPRTDLQQGTTGLQQVTGGEQSNTSNPNQLPATKQLTVETIAQPQPGQGIETATPTDNGSGWILWLLIVPVIIAIAVLWPRRQEEPGIDTLQVDEPAPSPLPQAVTPKPKKLKNKKKSTKRKKSARR